jgi:hypothetical protein
MIKIDVRVDDKNVKRRLNNLQKAIDSGVPADLNMAGRKLRDLVKLDMPKDTGSSAQSIIVSRRDFKGSKALLLTQSFKPHPEKSWNGAWFNIPRWMFRASTSKVVKHYVKSGNVAQMRKAPSMVFKEFKTKIVSRFKYSWRK